MVAFQVHLGLALEHGQDVLLLVLAAQTDQETTGSQFHQEFLKLPEGWGN